MPFTMSLLNWQCIVLNLPVVHLFLFLLSLQHNKTSCCHGNILWQCCSLGGYIICPFCSIIGIIVLWLLLLSLQNSNFATTQSVGFFWQCVATEIGDTVIPYSKQVRILGVTVDHYLAFDNHITTVVRSCSYHIRSLRHIRHLLDRNTANTLACSIVATRIDYCNSVLYGISHKNLHRLQRVQNSLAVVCDVPLCSPSTQLASHTLGYWAIYSRTVVIIRCCAAQYRAERFSAA